MLLGLGSDSEEYLPSSYCISSSSWIDTFLDEGIDHGLTGGVRKSVPCPEDEFVDVVHWPSLFYQEKGFIGTERSPALMCRCSKGLEHRLFQL